MKPVPTLPALLLLAAALLGGCASTAPQSSAREFSSEQSLANNYGTIDAITLGAQVAPNSGAGAVVGGVIGALAGNQVGGGSGRTAATVAGAVGGAVVGNSIEANRRADQSQQMYQIAVRLDNGERRTVVQDSVYDLRVGNRVRVIDGRVYRY